MKLLTLTAILCSFLLISCGNAGNVSSTPIDSTNANGTAPVEYSNGTQNESVKGATTIPDENQNADKVNTPNGDSVPANSNSNMAH